MLSHIWDNYSAELIGGGLWLLAAIANAVTQVYSKQDAIARPAAWVLEMLSFIASKNESRGGKLGKLKWPFQVVSSD